MDPEDVNAEEETLETEETVAVDEGEAVDDPAPDGRMEDLQRQADDARAEAAANGAAADALRTQLAEALQRYRELLLSKDPDVPPDMVEGDTIAELEASYTRASALVETLRLRSAEQAAQQRVPAGAPARRATDATGRRRSGREQRPQPDA